MNTNTIDFLLSQLNSESFFKRNYYVKQGYEEHHLINDPIVKEITKEFSKSPPSEELINNYLDKIFNDIQKEAMFEYELSVIALFIALHNANMPMFFKFGSYFREQKAVEIGNLRRYICRVYGSIT